MEVASCPGSAAPGIVWNVGRMYEVRNVSVYEPVKHKEGFCSNWICLKHKVLMAAMKEWPVTMSVIGFVKVPTPLVLPLDLEVECGTLDLKLYVRFI